MSAEIESQKPARPFLTSICDSTASSRARSFRSRVIVCASRPLGLPPSAAGSGRAPTRSGSSRETNPRSLKPPYRASFGVKLRLGSVLYVLVVAGLDLRPVECWNWLRVGPFDHKPRAADEALAGGVPVDVAAQREQGGAFPRLLLLWGRIGRKGDTSIAPRASFDVRSRVSGCDSSLSWLSLWISIRATRILRR